jgi:hypothetical protein
MPYNHNNNKKSLGLEWFQPSDPISFVAKCKISVEPSCCWTTKIGNQIVLNARITKQRRKEGGLMVNITIFLMSIRNVNNWVELYHMSI